MIDITGTLESIKYKNDDNHYTIAFLNLDRNKGRITIVGYLAGVNPGECLNLSGDWESHPKFGEQFKIKSYEIALPSDKKAIKKYLSSGIIKGIGKSVADKIIKKYGVETLRVIEDDPDQLLEVKGVGKSRIALIKKSWNDHHSLRNLMQFLQQNNVDPSYCAPLYKDLGQDAVDRIQSNPYLMIPSLKRNSFHIAESIADTLGFPFDSPERIKACVIYFLEKGKNDGHVFLYIDPLLEDCEELLHVPEHMIKDVLSLLKKERKIRIEKDDESERIYLRDLHRAEKGIADRIQSLQSIPSDTDLQDQSDLNEGILKNLAIKLSEAQLLVLTDIFKHKLSIITGGPGTGKTTLVRSVISVFEENKKGYLLAAPTGRAARRLSEVTSRKASTIHKLLEYNVMTAAFDRNQDNQLETDVVIIDEVSMVDTELMYSLLCATPLDAMVILVGDVFQLPSVGPGNVLSDLIESQAIQTFELKEIFRQAKESPIVVNAHSVRLGKKPDFIKNDDESGLSEFYFIQQNNPETVVNSIVEMCSKRIPKVFGFEQDIQVLTPMHKGDIGTINLNQVLQKVLNDSHLSIQVNGMTYKQGDKVMHLKNNYSKDVYNGDIGFIKNIHKKDKYLTVTYYGRVVEYEFSELDELTLAYAISVHKSQGSEYTAVIIPLLTQHFPLLQRNLLYTAMTRGKNLVIIIGTRHALSIALNNDKPQYRNSSLKKRLDN